MQRNRTGLLHPLKLERESMNMKLTVYLAARYSRREELCSYRALLEASGIEVTSRWLNGNHQISDDGLSAQAKEEERTRFALEDWEDLMRADVCISFTETPRSSNSRGGRHVEFGGALAVGNGVIVVGPRENVFHCLPEVHVFDEFWKALGLVQIAAQEAQVAPNEPMIGRVALDRAAAKMA
jgi:hypothetical protein